MPKPVQDYVFTNHALSEMERRGINKDEVSAVLVKPEQSEPVRKGRVVLQSKISSGDPEKEYLLRVFVDIDRNPPRIVTAYLTSKIDKYWR